MFDIGFPELLVIGVVTLLVIGPEQLPSTMRAIALWIGRMRRSFSEIRRDIEQGIGADEIRQQLHNEAILKEIERSKAALAQTQADIDSLAKKASEAMTLDDVRPAEPTKHEQRSNEP